MFGITQRLPHVVIPQSLTRSSLWAVSFLWPVTPVKRTRAEKPPFSTDSTILAHTGGIPECREKVTMATNQPSAMVSRSTGGTCSSYDVMLIYWLKLCAKSWVATGTRACWQPVRWHLEEFVQDDQHSSDSDLIFKMLCSVCVSDRLLTSLIKRVIL